MVLLGSLINVGWAWGFEITLWTHLITKMGLEILIYALGPKISPDPLWTVGMAGVGLVG